MDYQFEDSLRSITNLDNLLIWLIDANSGMYNSCLFAFIPNESTFVFNFDIILSLYDQLYFQII